MTKHIIVIGGGMPMVTLSGQQVADKINAREAKNRK